MSYAIYLREKPQNLPVQEQLNKIIQDLAIPKNQFDVFVDTDLSNRSGVDMLWTRTQQAPPDTIVIYNLKSLELTLKELVAFLSDLSRKNIQFVCMHPHIANSDENWTKIYDLLNELVLMQNEASRQRLIKSIKERRARGDHIGRDYGSQDKDGRKIDGYFKEAKQRKKFLDDTKSLLDED